jgi:REP element-mobilizing transposase RayT
MDLRSWLLSNTTFGTWLPGDNRGSVTSIRDLRPGDRVVVPPVAHAPGSSTGNPVSPVPDLIIPQTEPEASAPGGSRIVHNLPGTPWEPPIPGLYHASLRQMKGPPIFLNREQAEIILAQFQETAAHRRWKLRAAAIMCNHFHIVVQVADDPSPQKILADFKAYASRVLNRRYGRPRSETWWTTNGSKRKLRDERHESNAIRYVLYKQPSPLVVWSPELGRIV